MTGLYLEGRRENTDMEFGLLSRIQNCIQGWEHSLHDWVNKSKSQLHKRTILITCLFLWHRDNIAAAEMHTKFL